MNRRTFLTAATLALGLAPLSAQAQMIDYMPGNAEAAIEAGETVLLDFAADWCSTCRSQARTIQALRDENPAYDDAIAFYRVDWDEYGSGDLATSLNVPRRSTLVLFSGGQEVARIVAGTSPGAIQELLDTGL